MKRTVSILAALSIGAVSTTALAATYVVTPAEPAAPTGAMVATAPDTSGVLTNTEATATVDTTLGREFSIERTIVERAASVYGTRATFSSGHDLAPSIEDRIVAGNTLPAGVSVRPAPKALGDLPTLQNGDRWVAAGEHLIEVTPDDRIAMVVYDVLP